jgi:hypothetical protein
MLAAVGIKPADVAEANIGNVDSSFLKRKIAKPPALSPIVGAVRTFRVDRNLPAA